MITPMEETDDNTHGGIHCGIVHGENRCQHSWMRQVITRNDIDDNVVFIHMHTLFILFNLIFLYVFIYLYYLFYANA